MAFFVYILKSLKDNRYYIGSTSNVNTRLDYHNSGRQRSTKNRVPFILVYSEAHSDKKNAFVREKQIKAFKGGIAFKNLLNGV
jgi:putative endonuclease